ncbi:hypothetical protein [Neorhodopirellula pilleata]|uniref:hypothetical protein n=1 Tax=Neorhodopirellula pilleata TaxID=2714738 RepID=UPI0011B53110|nr:hypothetical protein [Neorhodopirellula pilleata]
MKHFVPWCLLWITVATVNGVFAANTWSDEAGNRHTNEPSLLSSDEILSGLAEPTDLFARLSIHSAYRDAVSLTDVQARGDLATTPTLGSAFPASYTWMTPGTYHHPLYFEQVNLERYGTGVHPCLQPALSAAHFFTTIPLLPYKMGDQCPGSTEYSLGHYRPGDCTPHYLHRRPWSWRGAGAQALFTTGLVLAVP